MTGRQELLMWIGWLVGLPVGLALLGSLHEALAHWSPMVATVLDLGLKATLYGVGIVGFVATAWLLIYFGLQEAGIIPDKLP